MVCRWKCNTLDDTITWWIWHVIIISALWRYESSAVIVSGQGTVLWFIEWEIQLVDFNWRNSCFSSVWNLKNNEHLYTCIVWLPNNLSHYGKLWYEMLVNQMNDCRVEIVSGKQPSSIISMMIW